MELIRQLVDYNLCKESKISYVFPPSSIRFIPNYFINNINHNTISILQNNYKDLENTPLIKLRYYWSIIKYFNYCLISALPLIKPPEPYSSLNLKREEDNEFLYIPFPKTISIFLSSAKGIILSTTKNNLLYDVLSFTEYSEDEVQIPTFKFKSLQISYNKNIKNDNFILNNNLTNEESLFLQAYEQGKDIDIAFYRSKKAPGDPHMGFKIEFKGELVQGLGGPYRQFFSDISNECIPNEKNIKRLKLFCPCPNNILQSNDSLNDKYVITSSNNNTSDLSHYEFLGVLMGICIRTGVHIPLNLCNLEWKKMTDTSINIDDVKEVDQGIIEQINFIMEIDNSENFDSYNLTYSCQMNDGTIFDLIPNGKYEKVRFDDRKKYLELYVKARLTESNKQIDAIKKGLYNLIPASLIKLMTHIELERYVSGGNDIDIDIDLLKQFTKYLMDLNENSNRIKWLWEILREFNQSDKRKFIKFCWAQEKLPSTKDEYERLQVIFSIKPTIDKNKKDIFPKADTCFFTLELPEYSSKEIMKNKILTAINLDNVSINADKANPDNRDNIDINYRDDYDDESI